MTNCISLRCNLRANLLEGLNNAQAQSHTRQEDSATIKNRAGGYCNICFTINAVDRQIAADTLVVIMRSFLCDNPYRLGCHWLKLRSRQSHSVLKRTRVLIVVHTFHVAENISRLQSLRSISANVFRGTCRPRKSISANSDQYMHLKIHQAW